MRAYKVLVAEAAEKDIADGFAWLHERNQLAADAFRSRVFDAIEFIAATPLAHGADADGNRHHVVRQFPYSVFYEVEADTVVILAVAHHRRRPGYWKAASRRPSRSK